jgi:hypothetical protein
MIIDELKFNIQTGDFYLNRFKTLMLVLSQPTKTGISKSFILNKLIGTTIIDNDTLIYQSDIKIND